MWFLDVVKLGVGVVESYAFRNRAEAVAKRDEILAINPEAKMMLQWNN
jgi:hypothetical protein